jgi:hypothetical protein
VVLTAAGAAVTTVFFGVWAASLLLWRLRLWTSWKPSSWVGWFAACGVILLPVVVLTFSSAFNSCKATVYVPYSALKSVFPDRALQLLVQFSSVVLTTAVHSALSRTAVGV